MSLIKTDGNIHSIWPSFHMFLKEKSLNNSALYVLTLVVYLLCLHGCGNLGDLGGLGDMWV